MIFELALRILEGESEASLILADYLEEFYYTHPEVKSYIEQLRKFPLLKVRTVLDVIAKFAAPCQRKAIRRIERMALYSLMSNNHLPQTHPIFSKKTRQRFNKYVSTKYQRKVGKKSIYSGNKEYLSRVAVPNFVMFSERQFNQNFLNLMKFYLKQGVSK